MAEQNKIMINDTEIWQPLADLKWSFATTYTEDSTRTQSGAGHFTAMFTVEQLAYAGEDLPASEVAKILQMVAKGKTFKLHYFSPYYGRWRDDDFYVGQGDLGLQTVIRNGERISALSFNMTGINPI